MSWYELLEQERRKRKRVANDNRGPYRREDLVPESALLLNPVLHPEYRRRKDEEEEAPTSDGGIFYVERRC